MQWRRSGPNAMLGKRYLLDTNAIVALLAGHANLLKLTEDAQWLGVSIINVLEFSGFDGLTDADRALFDEFLKRVVVVDLAFANTSLVAQISNIRKSRSVKLPDAIVLASAASQQATLLTADRQLINLGQIAPSIQVEAF